MSTTENTTPAGLTSSEKPKKKSLYQRYQDAKSGRNTKLSDDELLKYTGKTKAEINDWAKTQPGVAGNRAAGTQAMGPASGLGGIESAQGYGGWGTDAKGTLKFPPTPDPAAGGNKAKEKEKELDDESE